jgi:hypothetical protein
MDGAYIARIQRAPTAAVLAAPHAGLAVAFCGFHRDSSKLTMASPLQYLGSSSTKESVMNKKLIIASLVLGSSSVAMASPSVTFSADASASYGTTAVRDHRFDTAPPAPTQVYSRDRPVAWGYEPSAPVYRGRPMPQQFRSVILAAGMHFANDGRSFITVGSNHGRFGTLQISAAGGRTFIKQVYVQFENGQEQVLRNLDATLVGSQALTLDLDGGRRAIRRIVVYGNPLHSGWNGWRRAAGTFNVTAL